MAEFESGSLRPLYEANTILVANVAHTPIALSIAEQTLVGRKTGGNIAALTGANALLAMDISASVAELNLLDLAGLTAGQLLVATGAASAAWQSTGVVLTSPTISGTVVTNLGLTLNMGAASNSQGLKIISTGTEAGLQLHADSTGGKEWQILSVGAGGGGGVGNLQFYNSTDTVTRLLLTAAGVLKVYNNIYLVVDNGSLALFGGSTGIDGNLYLFGKDHANYPGAVWIQTPNAAKDALVQRLAITGVIGTAVATWAAITHTNIALTGASNAFGAYVLATGAGKTVDNVITALQALGLVTQT